MFGCEGRASAGERQQRESVVGVPVGSALRDAVGSRERPARCPADSPWPWLGVCVTEDCGGDWVLIGRQCLIAGGLRCGSMTGAGVTVSNPGSGLAMMLMDSD